MKTNLLVNKEASTYGRLKYKLHVSILTINGTSVVVLPLLPVVDFTYNNPEGIFFQMFYLIVQRQYWWYLKQGDDHFIPKCFLPQCEHGGYWCQKNLCRHLCQRVRGHDAHDPASLHSSSLLKLPNLIWGKWWWSVCYVMPTFSHHLDPFLRAPAPHESIHSSSIFD